MKVIKTRKVEKASDSQNDFYDGIANGFTEEPKAIDTRKVGVITTDGFTSILESSGLLGYILETLREKYLLRYADYGECQGVLTSWLVGVQSSFTPDVLSLLEDRDKIDEIGDRIIDNLINPNLIRSGVLAPKYKLPLIGESKHVIL